MSGVLRKEDDQGEAEVGERAGQGLGDNCQLSTVSGDDCQCGQLSVGTTVSGPTVSRPWTTVRGNCQSYEKAVRSYSCPLPNCQSFEIYSNIFNLQARQGPQTQAELHISTDSLVGDNCKILQFFQSSDSFFSQLSMVC